MNKVVGNKEILLNMFPVRLFPLVLLMSISLSVLIYFCSIKTMYNNYRTKGYVTCSDDCYITTMIPSDIDLDIIEINKKTVEYKVILKNLEVDTTSYESYYEINLSVSGNYMDKEIVNINFYYNKQRIIKKILDMIF